MRIGSKNINCCLWAIHFLTLFFLILFLPISSYSSGLFYTIQTGSFKKIEPARKQFKSIVQRLSQNDLDHLRIEKIGKFYTVRLGKFQSDFGAETLLSKIKPTFSEAIVMDAYIKDERIIELRKDSQFVKKDSPPKKSLSRQKTDDTERRASKKEDEKLYTKISAADHEKNGDKYMKTDHYFMAVEEYRMALKQGINRPALYWKLAMVLYNMGYVDEAIIELKKAIDLSPDTDIFRVELGVFYLAKGKPGKAKEQFFKTLKINPGLAYVYYYLGELFLKSGDYNMAWLAAKMARRLGHNGRDLIDKLRTLSMEPDVNLLTMSGNDLYIRQILVDTYEKAEEIRDRISGGEPFEDIARNESMGPNAHMGGFIGHFNAADVNPRIAKALLKRSVLADPVIIQTEQGFHIVQRILPFDIKSWKKLLSDSAKSKLYTRSHDAKK